MTLSLPIRRVVLAAALITGAPHFGQAAEPVEYRGTCDASAAVALDDGHFVVGNDEDNLLRVYRIGRPEPLASVDLDQFAPLSTRARELDVEGGARIGTRIYWITSHATNKRGAFRASRHRLFATDIVAPTTAGAAPGIVPTGRPYSTLVDDLAATPALAKHRLTDAAYLPPNQDNALNIEGLTATPAGTLLIGFRGPLSDGKALAVEIANPAQMVAGERLRVGAMAELDLGGLGIRAMARAADGYLIVAGGAGSRNDFRLFRWSGNVEDRPVAVAQAWPADGQPEALLVTPSGKVFVVSDDGNRTIGGWACKTLAPEHQRFRVVPLAP